jgi:hypothetical protein
MSGSFNLMFGKDLDRAVCWGGLNQGWCDSLNSVYESNFGIVNTAELWAVQIMRT